MSDQNWIVVRQVAGEIAAEILRGLLESQGLQVYLNQEGAGREYGLNIGPMGNVEILVPEQSEQEALKILAAYDAGEFEDFDENQG